MGIEPMIFWATTRRVNRYTTPAIRFMECYHNRLGEASVSPAGNT